MRIFPVITAILVVVVLFYAILQRDTLFEFAGGVVEEDTSEAAPPPQTSDAPADETSTGVHVMAYASKASVVDSAVLLRGQTEAARQVTVRAETQGLVISEPLRKGAYVEAGTLLCSLDPGTRGATLDEAQARLEEARARVPEAEARVAEAKSRVVEAEINETAASRLSEGGFASETRVASAEAALSSARAAVSAAMAGVQNAQAGIQSAEAALERARNELGKLEIRAPFAGLLETDTAELGSLLQGENGTCATIIQLDPIKLVGFVPETQVNEVTVGAPAGARLASGGEVRGRVTFLARSADPKTRTFRVEVEVPNTDLTIRDGQTVEIMVSGEGQTAHLLPASALTLNDEGILGVRVVDENDTAQFAPVDLLRDTAQGIWLGGLPDEVNVILVGQEYVTDNTAVVPSYEELSQ